MRCSLLYVALGLFTLTTNASAATFTFVTDPFAGSTALTTPGRQIVGGEPFVDFSIATDVFAFDPIVFGIDAILFANDVVASLPTTGINVVVLQTLDNDADPLTPFGAGNAATVIAEQITEPGPGFFIYFNSGLNLPRLVYSIDLSEPTADLKVLARLTSLAGQSGQLQLPTFTEDNFALTQVSEPASVLLMMTGGAWWMARRALRKRAKPRGNNDVNGFSIR